MVSCHVAFGKKIPAAIVPKRRPRGLNLGACERDYEPVETEFMLAMDQYKRDHCRPFPHWSEVIEVFRSLGWRHPSELN